MFEPQYISLTQGDLAWVSYMIRPGGHWFLLGPVGIRRDGLSMIGVYNKHTYDAPKAVINLLEPA